ncbi:MAG: alpha/beta hydrolase [Alphaproteobacteria bacterium]|nr:alpha/beta hydrolase [Alphaproteobacteria bacterium]
MMATDETATETLARLEDAAERCETPTAGGTMTWRIWGSGPPLVVFHGGHGSWAHWVRNIEFLARRYAVIAPDFPGYGDSDPLPGPPTAEGFAEAVSAGLDRVVPPPARYDLVGFSFGGIIGGATAVLQGDRIRTLFIIGSSGLGLPSAGIIGLRKWTSDMDDDALRAVHRNNLAKIMFADPKRIDDLALHVQTRNTQRVRVKATSIPRSDALLRALPHIKARIVCLSGARDVYVEASLAQRQELFRAVQPSTPFRFVDGAGHWVMYEAPEAFNATLVSLLEEASAGDPAAGPT